MAITARHEGFSLDLLGRHRDDAFHRPVIVAIG
jgi:hypothetical protein